jgi:hypothetical protein
LIKVDAAAFERLGADSKAYGKVLRKAVRKELTVIGRTGANEAKAKIRSMPVKGDVPYKQGGGLRRDIAAAIRTTAAVSAASGTSMTIRVQKTGALAAHNRYRVAQYLDSHPWRHPVYGKGAWVTQNDFPYFKDTLERLRPAMLLAANRALAEASATIR